MAGIRHRKMNLQSTPPKSLSGNRRLTEVDPFGSSFQEKYL